MRILLSLTVTLLATGCLHSEETDMRVLREGAEPAVVVIEQTNFYSDETDAAKVQKDFGELVENWRGADLPRQAGEDGILIRGRELFVREGKIVFRCTGLVENLNSADLRIHVKDSQIFWTLDGDDEVIETNGKALASDPRTLVWPANAPELHVKMREPLREGFQVSQPQMLRLLKDLLATEGGH